MEIGITEKRLKQENLTNSFVKTLQSNEEDFLLTKSVLFNEFPIYKDLDEQILIANILIISELHGVILVHIDDSNSSAEFMKKRDIIEDNLDNLYSILFTRTLRNKNLRKSKRELNFNISTLIYSPLSGYIYNRNEETAICSNTLHLKDFFVSNKNKIEKVHYSEIKSTIEGSKALLRSKKRPDVKPNSKGDAANQLEKEIASFDQFQLSANSSLIDGVSRIRGLAGSGKTVVLAIKAALTHLKYPEAKIVYTFSTKSLQQHIKRLITRFYRQFEDNDPNWENLEVIHAWGSYQAPGVYYNACKVNDIYPISYSIASQNSNNAFDYVCEQFLQTEKNIIPLYDYVFIDEGQDFSPSFINLCIRINSSNKILWAYDELQTIFLPKSPSAKEIFGEDEKGEPNIDFEEDIILYKCYRNPREILLVAHSIGFGIYSDKIRQMIESPDYWNDIGYDIKNGELKEGSNLEIERLEENSLKSISNKYNIDDLIKVQKLNNYSSELYFVAKCIDKDIKEGLLPEDILVITVDDRNATRYLRDLQEILGTEYNIPSNNVHADRYSAKEFQIDGKVTLSTVHKAKGNESYSVYIVGTETLYATNPSVKERNILFTAMTRSKGWVTLTGTGDAMNIFKDEISKAKNNFPYLRFTYPSLKDLRVMKRDIKEEAIRKSKSKKMIERALLSGLTPEEVKRIVDQLSTKKTKDS